MTDMQPLVILASQVADEPTEEHLEAFLQAYNAARLPEDKVEFMLYEVLADMTIMEYMDPACTCGHDKGEESHV